MVYKDKQFNFLKERLKNCEVKYLSIAKCWFTKTGSFFLKERSNNYEVKYLSVTKCWFRTTRLLFYLKNDQTIVRLKSYRLLNIGLQRQAIYLFKGKIKQLWG